MDGGEALRLTLQALWLVLLLSAPPVVAAAIVGLLIAILQAATQIQEQTFQYAAKLLVIVLTIFVTASMLGGTLYHFGETVFDAIPGVGG